MKSKPVQLFITSMAVIHLLSCTGSGPISGSYLGLPLPGTTPVVFAPGVISTAYQSHSAPVFSPDGKEVYWSMWLEPFPHEIILRTSQERGHWMEPGVAPFSGQFKDGYPFFSPDGNRLYFNSNRPSETGGEPIKGRALWYLDKTEGGWSDPHPFQMTDGTRPGAVSFASNGNAYFCRFAGKERNSDVYVSTYEDGEYNEAVPLSDAVNSEFAEFECFVDPDEKFIIISVYGRPGGYGLSELYISFKQSGGSWTKAVNMGEAINQGGSRFARTSPDGKVLFFTNRRGTYKSSTSERYTFREILEINRSFENGNEHVYWVDASVIDSLKSKSVETNSG